MEGIRKKRSGKRGREKKKKKEKEGIFFFFAGCSSHRKLSKTFLGKNMKFFPHREREKDKEKKRGNLF